MRRCFSYTEISLLTASNSSNDFLVVLEDDQLPLMLSCWCSMDYLMNFFFVSPSYPDQHEHYHSYAPVWLFDINLSLFLHKTFFKLRPVWNTTLNPNFCISFLSFGPIFGIKGKINIWFLSVLLLLLLLILRFFLFWVIK